MWVHDEAAVSKSSLTTQVVSKHRTYVLPYGVQDLFGNRVEDKSSSFCLVIYLFTKTGAGGGRTAPLAGPVS